MSDDWRVRPYRPGDEDALLALFEHCFGWRMTEAQWRWKLLEAPMPDGTTATATVWVAVDRDDQPIGQYGGMPGQLNVERDQMPILHASDSITDPRYRRRGILTALMQAAHQAWREAGFVAVIGAPTPNWGSRIEALDWRPIADLRWRIRPLRPEALLARRLGMPVIGRLSSPGRLWHEILERRARKTRGPVVTQVDPADTNTLDQLDVLDKRCRADGRVAMARSAAWVRWRFLDSPLHRYTVWVARDEDTLRGLATVRLTQESPPQAILVDLATPAADHATRQALISAVTHHAHTRGAESIASLTPPGIERDALLRGGFVVPRRKGYTFRCVPLIDPPPWQDTPHEWRLTGAELDAL